MVMNLPMLFVNIGLFIILLPILDWFKKRKTEYKPQQSPHLGFLSIAATLIATELGASLLLSSSDESFYTACYGLFYIIGISIGYLILGGGLAVRIRSAQCSTSAQFLEVKYHSPSLKKLASCLSTMIMYAFLVGELIATKSLLQGLGFTNELFFIILWFLLVLYCSIGGLPRLGISTFVQLSFFSVIFGGTFIYCLFKAPPSWTTITFFLKQQELTSFFSQTNLASLLLSLLNIIIYCISEQDVTHPLFSKKSRFTQIISSGGAGIFMILFSSIPLYFCYQAHLLNLEIPSGLSPIIPVIQYLTNDLTVIFILCGIIIAIITTFDYLFLAISTYWIEDFNLFTHPDSKSIITLVNGSLIMIVSYFFSTDLLSIFNVSFELYTCILLVPLFFSYVKKEVKKIAAWCAIGAGLISFIIGNCIYLYTEKEFVHLASAVIGYAIGSVCSDLKFSKKLRPALLRN
ncbi:MAG: hypothetical protein ACOYT8_04330 [Candidatus Dependentiae bacterium]